MKQYRVTFLDNITMHHAIHGGAYRKGSTVTKGQDFIDYITNDIAPKVMPKKSGEPRPLIRYDEIPAKPESAPAPKPEIPKPAPAPKPAE